jgi:hypothetical protein
MDRIIKPFGRKSLVKLSKRGPTERLCAYFPAGWLLHRHLAVSWQYRRHRDKFHLSFPKLAKRFGNERQTMKSCAHMKRQLLILTLLLLGFAARASAARPRLPEKVFRALDSPSEIILFSLHPDPHAAHWFTHTFHDYRILGQVPIISAIQRRQVAGLVKHAAQTYVGDTKCIFSPRHGVHLRSGSETYDFVICFECLQMEIYSGDQRLAFLSVAGSPDTLNYILRSAHVRIAK